MLFLLVPSIGLLSGHCLFGALNHIYFIWNAGAAIFRCNWQKTLRLSSCQFVYGLEHWGSCLRKCERPPSTKPEIYFRECYLCVCLSLFFHDDDDGVRLELFFNFLNLNCFHRPGLGLSNSLLRNLCVQVQPRLSLYPVTHTTQADLWSSALANRVLSLLCNNLFLG